LLDRPPSDSSVALKMPRIYGDIEKNRSQKGLSTEHRDFQSIEFSAFQVRQHPRYNPAQDLQSSQPYHSRAVAENAN
jgi:hypothetical protein